MIRRPRGFTLIELMLCVALIGIVSTVAFPSISRATLRSKSSERIYMMRAIRNAIEDAYRQTGRFPADPAVDSVTSEWNPVLPYSTGKRPFNLATPPWNLLNGLQVDGATYYSYKFEAAEGGSPIAVVWASGDLDGDGAVSTKVTTYQRETGVYLPISSVPPDGEEDLTTF